MVEQIRQDTLQQALAGILEDTPENNQTPKAGKKPTISAGARKQVTTTKKESTTTKAEKKAKKTAVPANTTTKKDPKEKIKKIIQAMKTKAAVKTLEPPPLAVLTPQQQSADEQMNVQPTKQEIEDLYDPTNWIFPNDNQPIPPPGNSFLNFEIEIPITPFPNIEARKEIVILNQEVLMKPSNEQNEPSQPVMPTLSSSSTEVDEPEKKPKNSEDEDGFDMNYSPFGSEDESKVQIPVQPPSNEKCITIIQHEDARRFNKSIGQNNKREITMEIQLQQKKRKGLTAKLDQIIDLAKEGRKILKN